MANICSFEVKMVGKENELLEIIKIFKGGYDYNLKKEIAKALTHEGMIPEKEYFTTHAKKILGRPLTREDFMHIPENKHFHRIFDIYFVEDQNGEVDFYEQEDDIFEANAYGSCAWSLWSAIGEDGYYKSNSERFPSDIYMGTSIQEVARMYPDVKMEIISEEPGCEFSERFTVKDGEVIEECATFSEVFIETEEDFEKHKKLFPEDVIFEDVKGEYFHTEFPEWFEGNYEEIYTIFTI